MKKSSRAIIFNEKSFVLSCMAEAARADQRCVWNGTVKSRNAKDSTIRYVKPVSSGRSINYENTQNNINKLAY